MNPSPYLLRFSGPAFQKWTCPSTTKYFSPSFSYKAGSPFPTKRCASVPDLSRRTVLSPHYPPPRSRDGIPVPVLKNYRVFWPRLLPPHTDLTRVAGFILTHFPTRRYSAYLLPAMEQMERRDL